jgi:hypothetical protein
MLAAWVSRDTQAQYWNKLLLSVTPPVRFTEFIFRGTERADGSCWPSQAEKVFCAAI